MGPTTKLPSLGHISFDEMAAAYEEQAAALIESGRVCLLVEDLRRILLTGEDWRLLPRSKRCAKQGSACR